LKSSDSCTFYVPFYAGFNVQRAIHNFRDWHCLLVEELSLGPLSTIALELVPFWAYAKFPELLQFLNASWKLCSVRLLSTACDSAWITSVVSTWRPFSSRGDGKVWLVVYESHVVFGKRFPDEKGSVKVRCRDAIANFFFVAKVRGEVIAHLYAVDVKVHSSMRNCLFGLPVNNPRDINENDEHALNFVFHLSRKPRIRP
jgi:hypothetical protein